MNEPRPFDLGTRTIRLCGKGTAVFSLPRAWMRNAQVAVGDDLTIEVLRDGALVVKAPVRHSKS